MSAQPSRKMKYQNGRSATSCSGVDSHKLTFRQANAKDLTDIKRMVFKERINPLGLSAERFIVAENADGQVLGFGQLQQQPSPQDVHFLELRTLIVDNDARGQGVGTAVMQHLLDTPAAAHTDVYLTTISRTMPFYHKAGFRELERRHTPRLLWFEALMGTLVAFLVVQDRLVVMKRAAPDPNGDTSAASSQTLL